MRSNRARRALGVVDNKNAIFPSYELILNPDEEARAITQTLENVEKGSKLMVKCTMSHEHFEKILFRANNENIGSSSGDGSSKNLLIESFSRENVGVYECGATRKSDGKYHSRQLRITQKRENSLKLPSCTNEDSNYCGDHGACFLDGHRKICHCDDGYMGETCDKVLMAAYDVKFLRVVGGTTTSLNVISIFITILFALLWWKERCSLKKLKRQLSKTKIDLEIEKLEKISCLENCEAHKNSITKADGSTTTTTNPQFENDSFARSSLRKMRQAFRTRLNGTSDSRLLQK